MARYYLPPPGGGGQDLTPHRRHPQMPDMTGYQPIPVYAPAPAPPPIDADSEGLSASLKVLWRHRWGMAAIIVICTAAAYLATKTQTPAYQARTTLEIQNLNENFMNMRELDPTAVNYGSDAYLQTQVRILQSESMLERVARKLNLAERRDVLETKPGMVSQALTRVRGGEPEAAAVFSPEDALARNLTVRGSGMTRIIELTFDSPDPEFAAQILNVLTEEYIEYNIEARWNTSQATGQWLGKHLQELKGKLENAENRLNSYAQNSNLLYTSERESVAEQRLKQLQEEFSRAQADRMTKQSRYELALNSPPESIPETVSDTTVKDAQSKIAELRRQYAELSASLTPAHPRVKKVEAQLVEVRASLTEARDTVVKRLRNEFETAQRREALLDASYGQQVRLVGEQGGKVVQYNLLKREVDSLRALYEGMLQKVKESSIASALRASNVRVVDRARKPSYPYKPNLLQNAIFGLLGGFVLGAAFAFVRERSQKSFRLPGDAAHLLNLPELGAIPASRVDKELKALPSGGSNGAGALIPLNRDGAGSGGIFRAGGHANDLTAWKSPESLVAETFRSALTSILLSAGTRSARQVLVLTSANPGDGKTTTVSNLGAMWARMGKRVLIIDADLRRPRLHEMFGMPNDAGLSQLLMFPGTLGDSQLAEYLHPTEVPGLSLLPAGPGGGQALDLLSSPRMGEIVESLRGKFDGVLIDTPPMLHISDARLVGRLTDGVILVIRAGKTRWDEAMSAAGRFNEDGTELLGTILNDWDPKAAGLGSNYYSGYHKYYSKAGSKQA